MSGQLSGEKKPSTYFEDLVSERVVATATIKGAIEIQCRTVESLADYLRQQQGSTLPLKGPAIYKRVTTSARNGWSKCSFVGLLPPEEYVVGDVNVKEGGLVVEVSKPATEGFERFGMPVIQLEFATPEEIAQYRVERERILADAGEVSGLGAWVSGLQTSREQII